MITMQKVGSARSFVNVPEVPVTSEAPSVTKLPVKFAVGYSVLRDSQT